MIRVAKQQDKNAVNYIRKQVHLLHATARPDMFRAEFCKEIEDRFDYYLQSDEYIIVVHGDGLKIDGFAVIKNVLMPQTPYSVERHYLLVEELGVDSEHRRCGIGAQLIDYVKNYAKQHNISRIQLDMWAFNNTAEEFYLSQGFETFRKYMEIIL